jgi:hypothetical protein
VYSVEVSQWRVQMLLLPISLHGLKDHSPRIETRSG